MMQVHKLILCSIFIGLVSAGVVAQTGFVTNEMRIKANENYVKKSWKEAEKDYAAIVAAEPTNTGARYRHGITLLELGNAKAAAAELETAFKASPNAVFALALARAEAAKGNKSKAFEMLKKVAEYGGANAETIEGAAEFSNLKGSAEFGELVKSADLAANPCKADPAFRQFDFWLGEWDVHNPQGIVVGSSSITKDLEGCVINEHYTTPTYAGKSINIYDRSDGKWHQTWVDIKGALNEYTGGIKDGKMVYVANERQNDRDVMLRMTFTPLEDGSVRQYGEVSFDGGMTWTMRYNLRYTKKK